jgi:glutamate dehydrogenase
MKDLGPQNADRVEAFVSTIDSFEPTLAAQHEDAFRVFARFISRSIDGRYLERHPPQELLRDLEQMMMATLVRKAETATVHLRLTDDPSGRRGVLTTCMPDQRFIYSITRLGLDYLGLKTYRSINSVVPMLRNGEGELISVGATDAPRESFIWVEVEADNLKNRRSEIEEYLRGRLHASQTVVEDFNSLTAEVQAVAARFETLSQTMPGDATAELKQSHQDSARLLRWLLNEHFVFLGTRYLPREGHPPIDAVGDFGVGRLKDWRGIKFEHPEREEQVEGSHAPFLRIRKSNTESWVYRNGRTDHVLVQTFDAAHQPAGMLIIEGIFSYPGLAEPRTSVPLLDRVIDKIYAELSATKGSHRYRTIRNAFNSLPLEYLFALPTQDVRKLVEQVLEVDAEHRSQIHITTDELQSIAFIFVALPRSHYSDELRADIRRLLKERFRASSVDDGVYAGNFDSVTFHYFLTGATPLEYAGQQALKTEIDQIASPWTERLYDGLVQRHGQAQARTLHNLYNEAFPSRYREETSIARAIEDIAVLEAIGTHNRFDCDLYQEKNDQRLGVTRLRLFQTENLLLSDILPILDNFGLVVIDQFPTTVHVPGRNENTIATFRISGVQNLEIDLTARRNRLRNAIRAVVLGAMSNDPLNRLLLRADIPWPNVVLTAAYASYARQLGMPYGQATVQETLLRHADVVRAITELFRAKFDPEIEGQDSVLVDDRRLQLVDRTRRALLVQLESVEDLTSDQVLRTLYNLVEATVRTNFYSRDNNKDYHLVLKFDPQLITRMPEPRPYREIYVFHPQVAGLHLRGGPAARGGIRWSDRLLDFRTEVLGLMATQNLKNVLIIPRGAKGAFVLRQPPIDLAARRAHADEMYKVFIGGLLEITDNLVEAKPVTPKNVLCYDGTDHYLVVAADKGTAHLSDTANRLAADHNFWLGDAFASGGSQGYDHKKEAITSRGAWACVQRHFREISMDPERDKIRVVGIGDMSGDVFGNGLLRSKSLQLCAAFDHRNFFIDPNPEPMRSYEARCKLFETPRSSWEDYDRSVLSEGGGIYPRSAKSIKLSPQARAVLGIVSTEPLSGPELAQAILKAPVDLFWNGGIGTYIKASTETHLDVGDPANDGVRVDGTEVRAKVIGEGGNLGITPSGRVELASRGVRLNTDAVDNSAGVDLSDHEVNLKILFQRAKEFGGLTDAARDKLMDDVRVEVGHKVVSNNWLQSRMLSLDELRSKRDMSRFLRSITFLADRTPFKRRDSNLPGERMARQRNQRGEGLYRCELAYIAANAKLDMRQELGRAEAVFPLEGISDHLFSYFPPSLTERFKDDIWHHPLAINIARTILTNWVIGDAGCSWLPETSLMTGKPTAEILQSYFAATELLGARALKQHIDVLEPSLEAAVEYRLRLRVEDALEEVSTWLLRHNRPISGFRQSFAAAMQTLPSSMAMQDDLRGPLHKAGADSKLIDSYAVLGQIDEVLDVAQLAADTGEPMERAIGALYAVGNGTGLLGLLRRALDSTSTDDLDRPARFALRGQLRAHLVQLATALLRTESQIDSLSEPSRTWIDSLQRELAPLDDSDRPLCNLVMASERISRRVAILFG